MEWAALILFWYGMLHAMSVDHLTVIAQFSIGKQLMQTAVLTALFALGHGLSLVLFALFLQSFDWLQEIAAYGDRLAGLVIIGMGLYLCYQVLRKQVVLSPHQHAGQTHLHIGFGKTHQHRYLGFGSILVMSMLMGLGGVRGVVVALGMLESSQNVITMLLQFALGVAMVFLVFGLLVLFINRWLLTAENKNEHRFQVRIRQLFAVFGLASVGVGSHLLLM